MRCVQRVDGGKGNVFGPKGLLREMLKGAGRRRAGSVARGTRGPPEVWHAEGPEGLGCAGDLLGVASRRYVFRGGVPM
jgi:hypothetical protein